MSLTKSRKAKYSKSFKYTDDKSDYDFRLKKRFPWWILLLLLLPLLLLVRCSKDIKIVTLDPYGGPVANATVNLDYVEHQLVKEKKFHYQKEHQLQEMTDSTGIAVFKKVRYGVYSWLFKGKELAKAEAQKGMLRDSTMFRYHRQSRDTIVLGWELNIEVRWRRTNEPVPGADLNINYEDNVDLYNALLSTDENGRCALKTRTMDGRIVTALVSKEGTSGTLALNEPFLKYTTQPLVIYLEEDVRCSTYKWQATNSDAWYSVRTFDLGKAGIDFKFTYFSSVIPDIFRVFEGTPEMIMNQTAKLIFSYGDKIDPKENPTVFGGYEHTGSTHLSTTLHSDSRQISVLVICDFPDQTYWEYQVECL